MRMFIFMCVCSCVQESVLYVFLNFGIDCRVGFHDVTCVWLDVAR
jgi:hypothetical protein